MRIITNHQMADIEGDLLESGTVDIQVEPTETHRNWCGMVETGHMGPCRTSRLITHVTGVFGLIAACYTNGRLIVNLTRTGRIPTDTDMTPVLVAIASLAANEA